MTLTTRAAVVALTAITLLASNAATADHERRESDGVDLLLGIASSILLSDETQQRDFSRSHHVEHGRTKYQRAFHRGGGYRNEFASSFTSEPIRGGSSRRTRIIENPFPGRPITGISFTGIERNEVHINDVITYPRKRLISHRGYSLSHYHPSPFLSTRGYVDYISVKAKRKEYFTVTFHYE